MSKKIIGVTVGTTMNPARIIPSTDTTLTQPGKAADAKAVGDALQQLGDDLPSTLPSPYPLTINGKPYDGSAAVEINLSAQDGGAVVHIGTEAPTDESITLWVDTDAESDGGGGSVDIDASLSVEGAAADAKAVGDTLTKLSDEVSKKESTIPKLTQTQKSEIKDLANAYYDNGNPYFFYEYEIVRNDLANNRFWNYKNKAPGKFGICCNVFVELLWMGRKVTDFIGKNGASYSNAIDKAFEWGYMFNFADRRTLAGAAKRDENGRIECDSDGNPTGYYNLVNPNGDYTWAYSTNTYYDTDVSNEEKYPARQWFHSFMTADCVAQELYRMGCEIPYDELDVGDLVFTKKRWKDNTEYDTYKNELRWRKISHVLMVLEKDDDGTLKFIDCAYRVPGQPFLKCSVKSEDKWDAARAVEVIGNVAMCARHPAAFGKSNMSDIERIDYLPMCYQSGFSTGQAIPFTPGDAVTKDLWYVYNNELGQAKEIDGPAAAWNDTNFVIAYTNATSS